MILITLGNLINISENFDACMNQKMILSCKNIPAIICCMQMIHMGLQISCDTVLSPPPRMAWQCGGIFSVVRNKTLRRVANRVHGSFNRKIGRTASRRSPHYALTHIRIVKLFLTHFFIEILFPCTALKTALRLSIHV